MENGRLDTQTFLCWMLVIGFVVAYYTIWKNIKNEVSACMPRKGGKRCKGCSQIYAKDRDVVYCPNCGKCQLTKEQEKGLCEVNGRFYIDGKLVAGNKYKELKDMLAGMKNFGKAVKGGTMTINEWRRSKAH